MVAVAPLLQVSEQPSESVALALQAYELVGAALGVVIAYLAYRGYRRNGSRPMLFVALGFALALGVPLVLTVAFLALPLRGLAVEFQLAVQTIEIAGLVSIIYGLRL
jgi:uncharacterized membrane protein (DUF441 family)